MKCLVLLCSVLIAQCHVPNRPKTQPTTSFSIENDSVKEVTMNPFNRDAKGFNKDLSRNDASDANEGKNQIYLDDVLFALRNQNFTDGEELCLNQTVLLLHSLENFTLWAVWQWDAQSSQPQGLMFGNHYQLGNFDQCMAAPWADSYQGLRTKYCLADIELLRTDKAVRRRSHTPYYPYQSALDFIEYTLPHSSPLNRLTWGACAPSVCSPKTIERLLGIMLARSHLGTAGMKANISIKETCQNYDGQEGYDELFYAFIILTGLLILICLICSYLNDKITERKTLHSRIIQAFCLKENAQDLFKMKKSGLEVFYGIRFLTICLIVLDHQFGISNSGPISDKFNLQQEYLNSLGLLMLHNDLFVDSFFLLSGFLTVIHLVKLKRMPNPLLLILKRYIRLIVAFAVVIFYLAAVFKYTGSGPLWNRAVAGEAMTCRKNWWVNILMLHNYIDVDNMCIVISWYIPCDFHFFVVTVLVYWVYRRWRILGLVCGTLLTAASIILPGLITYIYELPPFLLFSLNFLSNPRTGGGATFPLTYVPSHTRYAAYLVGFFAGYFFSTHYKPDGPKLSKKWSMLGTVTALTIMPAVMLMGSTYLWRNYSALEGAIYASLNRPIWSCAVVMFVFCCVFGHVPLLKSFLSFYAWVPLSRLSYGLYLTHTIFITRNVYVTRNPQHNDYVQILFEAAGTIFWGCIAALLIWLLAEAPVNKLFAICLQPKVREEKADEECAQSTETTSGHLQENMSSTSYLSKI